MANYLPKMKIGTVRDMARKMIATSSGQKVTNQAFNKFLKEDKNLRRAAYSPIHSTVEKYKAVKFFGHLANKVAQSNKYKLSYFAKKIGVKASAGVGPSKVTLDRIYKKAVKEEIAGSAKPTGPSKEETERQQRRQQALRTLHKRERADEVYQEEQNKGKTTTTGPRAKPVQIAQGGASGLTAPAIVSDKKATGGRTKQSLSGNENLPSLAVLPLSNPKRNLNASWVVNKLDNWLIRVVKGLKRFRVEGQLTAKDWLRNSGWQEGDVINLELARDIGRKADLDFVMMGEWLKDGIDISVSIQLINIKENKITKIAKDREKEENIFELENRLSWEIQNFFTDKKLSSGSENDKEEPEIPSSREATDLPI